ncbi:MAG: hypothetical protein RML72_03535, partial [Bacteroidia bacterium]|nr:hypothetical protein [Bacteroidia bacterium]
YTSWDIKAFADDVWQEADENLRQLLLAQWQENADVNGGGNSFNPPIWCKAAENGFPLAPFVWQEQRRAQLMAELDALYALLYGLNRKQLRYILDPSDLTPKELEDILSPEEEIIDPLDPKGYEQRQKESTFIGETFRVLKKKEIEKYGEYRKRRLVLSAFSRVCEQFQK